VGVNAVEVKRKNLSPQEKNRFSFYRVRTETPLHYPNVFTGRTPKNVLSILEKITPAPIRNARNVLLLGLLPHDSSRAWLYCFPHSTTSGMNHPAASRSLIPLRSISAGYLGASLWNLGKPTVSQTLP